MNIQFRQLYLPQPPEVDADALIELAKYKQDSNLNPPALPDGVNRSKTFSRSNIDEIIQDIVDSNTQNITVLEWIHCLFHKPRWDDENIDRSELTSQAIWKAAEQNNWLKQKLFWNLVLYHGGKINFAKSLSKTMSAYAPQDNLDIIKVKIIRIIKQSDFADDLGKLCCQEALTPKELFSANQLPRVDAIIYTTLNNIVNVFSSSTNLKQKQYL